MVSMDLKGITWVGHVYQKFEAMCLEVEEVMYQFFSSWFNRASQMFQKCYNPQKLKPFIQLDKPEDTVKYVENQVQTVGASVKKFYSDVMEDFLPPSSMDLVKGTAASNLPAEQYIDIGIYKKAKVGMREEAMKFDPEQCDDSQANVDLDEDVSHGPAFHGFDIEDTSFHPSSEKAIEGASSDLYSKQYDNRMHSKRRLGSKKISEEENLSLSEMFGAITHMAKDLSRASSFSEQSGKNREALSDQMDTSPSPFSVEENGYPCTEEICDEFENASKGRTGVLTDGRGCNEIEHASVFSSCNNASTEANAADICKNNRPFSLVGSSVNGDVRPSEFPNDIILVCHPGLADNSTADAIESDIAVEQDLGTIQQVAENCVLVNGDELHFVPQKERKHRAYKKKIRNAISSRMISARKQEYKQLAKCYGENVNSNQECAQSLMRTTLIGDMKRSPSQNLNELDWELL